MKRSIWTMCVVGLMVAAPVVCRATTVEEALAVADDGKYIQMGVGDSITLAFNPPLTFDVWGGEVVLNLSGPSDFIRVWWGPTIDDYRDYTEGLYEPDGAYTGALRVWLPEGTWNYLKIEGAPQYSGFALYLDAVEAGGSDVTVTGTSGDVAVIGEDTPAEMIAGLIEQVKTVNANNGIPDGIANSLEAKLQNAVEALEEAKKNCNAAAANKLQAFINEVEAQAGNQIGEGEAASLADAALAIIDALTTS